MPRIALTVWEKTVSMPNLTWTTRLVSWAFRLNCLELKVSWKAKDQQRVAVEVATITVYCSQRCATSLNCKPFGEDTLLVDLFQCCGPNNSVVASISHRKKLVKQLLRTCTDQISSESNALPTHLNLVQSTQASGKAASVMALVSRRGMMGPSIVVNGERIELMARAALSMSMVMFTMATGPTIKLTAAVSTST